MYEMKNGAVVPDGIGKRESAAIGRESGSFWPKICSYAIHMKARGIAPIQQKDLVMGLKLEDLSMRLIRPADAETALRVSEFHIRNVVPMNSVSVYSMTLSSHLMVLELSHNVESRLIPVLLEDQNPKRHECKRRSAYQSNSFRDPGVHFGETFPVQNFGLFWSLASRGVEPCICTRLYRWGIAS